MEHSIGGSVNLRAKTDKSAHIDEGMIEAGAHIRNSLGYPDQTSNSYNRPNRDLHALLRQKHSPWEHPHGAVYNGRGI
jgi:hypothetical protein